MARTRRHRGGRKHVGWRGWGRIAPQGAARTRMLRKCGRKCFLGPRSRPKSFPICAKGTCRVSDKGLWAAYIRAREWGQARRSYRGKARPRDRRRVYTRIARRARSRLQSRGRKVGWHGGNRRTRRR